MRPKRLGILAPLLFVGLAAGASVDYAKFLTLSPSAPTRADAIVILPGGISDRSKKAAELFLAGIAPEIWIPRTSPAFAAAQADALQALGIPPEAIRVVGDTSSTSTMTDGLAVREHVTANGGKRVVVVTSWFHGGRTAWTMRRALAGTGVEVSYALAKRTEQNASVVYLEYLKWAYYMGRYGLVSQRLP